MAKWIIFAVGMLILSVAQAQGPAHFEEGTSYHWVATKQSATDKIEVAEFFWYGCPHCFSFEPFIAKWLERKPQDVDFVKFPATFNRPEVMMHAKTFYALEAIGAPASIHYDIMNEMHNNHNRLQNEPAMDAFLATKGIDMAAYHNAFSSFAVYVKVQQAAQLAQRYAISGVPSLVVDGQFRSGDVKSYDEMIALLDFLVAEARNTKGQEAGTAQTK